LNEIFNNAGYKNPPAGAAECAGIKLLQYAFLHHMKPLALGEFWWGKSPKSNTWKHGMFYPCCKEKCEPILKHMLS
ncbi:MAG: pseudouridylate synthase, partial [Flavobacterium sp.]